MRHVDKTGEGRNINVPRLRFKNNVEDIGTLKMMKRVAVTESGRNKGEQVEKGESWKSQRVEIECTTKRIESLQNRFNVKRGGGVTEAGDLVG